MATEAKNAAAKAAREPALNVDFSALFAASRVYIVEHFVVHITLILIAVSGISLYNSVIDHLMSDATRAASPFDGGIVAISLQDLAIYIAMALVAVPLFGLFYVRTRKAERAHPELMLSRARRRLIYVSMSIAALFMLGYAISFVYTSVLVIINAEANVTGESWVQSSLKQVFAISFIGLLTYLVSRLTLGIDEEKK